MTGHGDGEQWDACRVCGRVVLVEGAVNRMEAALDNRGQSPVVEWLNGWIARPRRARVRKLAELVAALEDFAEDPARLRITELNQLGPGLWELKVGKLRLPFVGGGCRGTVSSAGHSRTLVLPAHVPPAPASACCARATHGFEKGMDSTPMKEKDRARAIGREDERQ